MSKKLNSPSALSISLSTAEHDSIISFKCMTCKINCLNVPLQVESRRISSLQTYGGYSSSLNSYINRNVSLNFPSLLCLHSNLQVH